MPNPESAAPNQRPLVSLICTLFSDIGMRARIESGTLHGARRPRPCSFRNGTTPPPKKISTPPDGLGPVLRDFTYSMASPVPPTSSQVTETDFPVVRAYHCSKPLPNSSRISGGCGETMIRPLLSFFLHEGKTSMPSARTQTVKVVRRQGCMVGKIHKPCCGKK